MNPPGKISLLLAEDHTVVRQGLCALLELDGEFLIVGQARTGREAVDLASVLRPDVILMDIAMPDLNGVEATKQILAATPGARIAILSAHSEDEYIDLLMAAGATGFLEKQASASTLTKALHAAAEGKPCFSPSIARRLAARASAPRTRDGEVRAQQPRLTRRESEVLQLVAEGAANKQVAGHLGISIKTVEKHRQHLMDKLGIHETAGLTRYALEHGVIERQPRLAALTE